MKFIPENPSSTKPSRRSPISEGSCVIDDERQIGYVRPELGPGCSGPDSALWDGWFNVTPTRGGNPMRGKAMNGSLVQLVYGGAS